MRPAAKRGMDAACLATDLDGYRRGEFRVTRLFAEIMEEDDDVVAMVGKRFDHAAQLNWEIQIDADAAQDRQEEAERHREVLRAWYSGVEVQDVLRQDRVGGVGMLVRNILEARAVGHSVHEWIWRLPASGSGQDVTALLRHCPPWWFEGRLGRLRFLLQDWDYYGTEMVPGEWLVAADAPGLMRATSILWLYKNLALRDWLNLVEKFGIPGLLGFTSADPDSEDWNAFKSALAQFGPDFAVVAQEGTRIEAVTVPAATGNTPQSALCEMLKRAIYVVWLGGDLSTLSASTGQGQGASVQSEGEAKLEQSDASYVSEILQSRVDRRVIAYHFGEGTRPLAYFRLVPTPRQDTTKELAVDRMFSEVGVPQTRAALYQRYGRPAPEPDAAPETLVFTTPRPSGPANPPGPAGPGPVGTAANAAEMADQDERMAPLWRAAARDLAPLRARLSRILSIADDALMAEKLRAFAAQLPELGRDMMADPEMAAQLERLLGQAFVAGLEPARNTAGGAA